MPIINHGKFISILYLENNLSKGAFTPNRWRFEILSAEAAISIENALLFTNLEDKVEDRTRDLNNALKELQEKDGLIQRELSMASNIQQGILRLTC